MSRQVVDVRDVMWLDNDMTSEQITWSNTGQSLWTANHYGNDVEVWLDDDGRTWGWRVRWADDSPRGWSENRGWADSMDEAKAEATR